MNVDYSLFEYRVKIQIKIGGIVMNRIFKVIGSKIKKCYIVVSSPNIVANILSYV